jgi:hypothetical protein
MVIVPPPLFSHTSDMGPAVVSRYPLADDHAMVEPEGPTSTNEIVALCPLLKKQPNELTAAVKSAPTAYVARYLPAGSPGRGNAVSMLVDVPETV